MNKETISCSRCGEYIGKLGSLTECPVCEHDFSENLTNVDIDESDFWEDEE